MKTFRTKPKTVQAEQFWPDVKPWPQGVIVMKNWLGETIQAVWDSSRHVIIEPGDWLVYEAGECRIVCQREFDAQYEPDECITA